MQVKLSFAKLGLFVTCLLHNIGETKYKLPIKLTHHPDFRQSGDTIEVIQEMTVALFSYQLSERSVM